MTEKLATRDDASSAKSFNEAMGVGTGDLAGVKHAVEDGIRLALHGVDHTARPTWKLNETVEFYRDVLGFRVAALWAEGAYLEAGPLWLCLSLDPQSVQQPARDYTHVAFDVDGAGFEAIRARLQSACAPTWKDNRSEGASHYFLDPDGHRLELHVGSLRSRLDHYRATSHEGVTINEA